MRQRQRHYSLHTYFFVCVQLDATSDKSPVTCRSRHLESLHVAIGGTTFSKSRDIVTSFALNHRSLTWILLCPSLRNAIFGWTVHNLLFKRFPKGWQLIQQSDIDVPHVCLYWCREWNLHCRLLFYLRCTGIMPGYNEGRRCNDKLILEKFDRRHLCMKTVNCVACNWTQIYFLSRDRW